MLPPRLHHTIPHQVAFVGAEDAEEGLQDATLLATRLLARARAKGKTVTPGNVAYYTLLHVRSGRRSHSAGRSDVMGTRTQLVGHSRVTSLEAPLAPDDAFPDDTFTLGDVLASEAEDPSETAARNLDWQAFVATLDARTRAILSCRAREVPLQTVADAHAVSRSTVQTWRKTLPQAVREFMGEELLHWLQQAPAWQESLRSFREQLACRVERRVA